MTEPVFIAAGEALTDLLRTGAAAYDDWYGKLWAYAWLHFVDHRYGAW
jgi:mannose/cellobiose epimerase-like protein (N-acyl-D-glucosamine 2-epimerase family)